MRFFIKLAVLVLAMHGWSQAQAGWGCDTTSLQESVKSINLVGDTYLEPDYYVKVEYHDELTDKNSNVIIYAGDGDLVADCHIFKREILAQGQPNNHRYKGVSFFKLINAATNKEVGFGSCIYDKQVKQSCEYLFESQRHSRASIKMTKVYVDITKRRFTSYEFIPGNNWIMLVETILE